MKYIILLISLVTASARPMLKTWTLDDLSRILSICVTVDKCASHPTLADALNKVMDVLYKNEKNEKIFGALPSPSGSDVWTRQEISNVLQNGTMDDKYLPYLRAALLIFDYDKDKNSVQVLIPAIDVSTWTLDDLSEALNDPSTSPELMPYLETAYTQFKVHLMEGKNMETISIITPVGLVTKAKGDTLLFPAKKILADENNRL